MRRGAASGVLLAGAVAGALDISYAMVAAVARGRSALLPVQAVVSGLVGSRAFGGGWASFAGGLALHLLIAIGAATWYYLASRQLALLRRRVVLPGAVFGVAVYLFMNFVVLPLSAVPFRLSHPPRVLAEGLLVHVLLVGLPIAYFVRRVWREAPGAPT